MDAGSALDRTLQITVRSIDYLTLTESDLQFTPRLKTAPGAAERVIQERVIAPKPISISAARLHETTERFDRDFIDRAHRVPSA